MCCPLFVTAIRYFKPLHAYVARNKTEINVIGWLLFKVTIFQMQNSGFVLIIKWL